MKKESTYIEKRFPKDIECSSCHSMDFDDFIILSIPTGNVYICPDCLEEMYRSIREAIKSSLH